MFWRTRNLNLKFMNAGFLVKIRNLSYLKMSCSRCGLCNSMQKDNTIWNLLSDEKISNTTRLRKTLVLSVESWSRPWWSGIYFICKAPSIPLGHLQVTQERISPLASVPTNTSRWKRNDFVLYIRGLLFPQLQKKFKIRIFILLITTMTGREISLHCDSLQVIIVRSRLTQKSVSSKLRALTPYLLREEILASYSL